MHGMWNFAHIKNEAEGYSMQMPEELKKENRKEYQHNIYFSNCTYSTAFAFTGFRESAAHSIDM